MVIALEKPAGSTAVPAVGLSDREARKLRFRATLMVAVEAEIGVTAKKIGRIYHRIETTNGDPVEMHVALRGLTLDIHRLLEWKDRQEQRQQTPANRAEGEGL